MTMNSIMGKPLKHYATDEVTNARYVMLALENDTDKNTCSVVDIDTLDPDMRAELCSIIDSDECQRVIDPWKVLDRRFFMNYPKQTVLAVLRAMRKIKVVNSDQVLIQLPNDATQTAKEVADAIREYNRSKKPQTTLAEFMEEATHNEEVKQAENKNAEDIKELKEQVSTLSSSIAELISMMKSKETKSKK